MKRLRRLLRPKTIAVIGGGAWCESVIRACRDTGFAGDIWPVHPKRTEVAGAPAFPSLADLPAPPDASFIGVNRHATIDVMQALTAMGAGGAVCFASGFREAEAELEGGTQLQEALLAAAGPTPFLGPNCYGFINAFDDVAVWPDQHGLSHIDRGVGIVTQSSNIALNLTMQRRGLPIGYVVAVGNQAQIGLAEIGRAILEDPRVTALGLHIEGIGDLRAFEALAAAAREQGKPIVALKVGASDQAQAATISHTASLAGSEAGANALLDRLGVGRVASLSTFLEALKLAHVLGPLESRRVAIMCCSGGEASLVADSAVGLPLELPPLNEAQRRDLRAALGPKVALANPLDYHTYIWGDREALTRCFSAMTDPSLALGCVVVDFPQPALGPAQDWDRVVEAIAATRLARGVPMAALATLPDTMPAERAQAMTAAGVAPLTGVREGLEAMAVAASIGAAWRRSPAPPLLAPRGAVERSRTLTEAAAKELLAVEGLSVPTARRAASPAEAARFAAEIGFPVVLKGEGAAHKTEAGLVALNLSDRRAVEAAAHRMSAPAFLVEEMVADGVVELLVGVVRDPAHGFVLTLGAGGVWTEILDDAQSLLIPAAEEDVADALDRLKIAPLLSGHRGAPPADRASIIEAVMAVQRAVGRHADHVLELEINPLIATPKRAVAVDALIRMGGPHD